MGLSGTVWPLHMGVGLYSLGRALRYARSKKNSEKSNFLVGGLAHGREIFRVGAAFVAAHLPPTRLFVDRIHERSYFPETTPTFRKVNA